ncbi:MAG: nucleotidyl transferase AbiEii/AbiGii toxin family protein [Bacteroidia bacterium]|nr:nucleotidyl transferase AbiEii/AbiGii toxin family protein [Bacteroidia bacterium]
MHEEVFNKYSLAGGTALALQMGHRVSVDLDFFGNHVFDPEDLFQVYSDLGGYQLLSQGKNILIVSIKDIKIDVINYRYDLLEPIVEIDGLRLYSLPDIAAMKLAAVTGRGRKRDFFDLFFLLKKYSLSEIMNFYQRKYPDGSVFLVAKSLLYFVDADTDEDPIMLADVNWEMIKQKIQEEVASLYNS